MANCTDFATIIGQAVGTMHPSAPIADHLIAELVRRALAAEPALALCSVQLHANGNREAGGAAPTGGGEIAIRVVDGTVMLDGKVPCLGQKRLAGALAWWVPGSRIVVNGLSLITPEPDSEAAITDAVRLVLKKDPFINSDQVQVTASKATVILDGRVPTELARAIAEHDAWYVYGVEEVVNRIAVG